MTNNDLKQRHGCVTFWLWLVLLVNLGSVLMQVVNLFDPEGTVYPVWTVVLLVLLASCNVVASLLLMRWRKLGFYLFVASALAELVVGLLLLDYHPVESVTSLASIAIWWAVLQIRYDGRSAWSQME